MTASEIFDIWRQISVQLITVSNLRYQSNCNEVSAIDVYASINIKQMDRIAPLLMNNVNPQECFAITEAINKLVKFLLDEYSVKYIDLYHS